MRRHAWEPTDRSAWTKHGARLTVYRCSKCRVIHGGSPHGGRCGDGCGNFYPELGKVPPCGTPLSA